MELSYTPYNHKNRILILKDNKIEKTAETVNQKKGDELLPQAQSLPKPSPSNFLPSILLTLLPILTIFPLY